jgi:antitoxin VapB
MLNIKTDEADRLARDLTELTGETMADAVTNALRERLERVRSEQLDARLAAEVERETQKIIAKYDLLAAPIRELRASRETAEAFVQRISRLTGELLEGVDRRPVTEDEWIEAGGDDLDLEMLALERQKK